jgi:hypothetical protein
VGNRACSASATLQCVVAASPSNKPAAAKKKLPVHSATRRCKRGAAAAAQATTSALAATASSMWREPTMMAVSGTQSAPRLRVACSAMGMSDATAGPLAITSIW